MFTRGVITRAQDSVCSVGFTTVPFDQAEKDSLTPHQFIVGTGFLVRPDVVLTNRHVVLKLNQKMELEGIPENQRCIAFDRVVDGKAARLLAMFGKYGVYDHAGIDLAVISFDARSAVAAGLALTPVTIMPVLDISVGDQVGMMGYPFGAVLHERDDVGPRTIYRVGPTFQQGYISAIAPFNDAVAVTRLLLDIRTRYGMSGAPVIGASDGTVIGIHDRELGDSGTTSFALPLSVAMIDTLCDALATEHLQPVDMHFHAPTRRIAQASP